MNFKFSNFFKNTKKGFLSVEVLVAVSIITLSVLAATGVAQKAITFSRQNIYGAQATMLLEEGAQAVKIVRDGNWANISSLTPGNNYYPTYTGGTWTLSSTPNSIGIFTRRVVFSNVNREGATGNIVSSGGVLDAGTKLVNVYVSWVAGSDTYTRNISFYIMDIF